MKNRTNKRRIYNLYRDCISLNAARKRYKLEDLLAEIRGPLPRDEGWDKMVPVGRGSEVRTTSV